MRKLMVAVLFILAACTSAEKNLDQSKIDEIKNKLLTLERKWLEAEFNLDTAYIATFIDSSFIGISSNHITNRQQELDGIYSNISSMRSDSIFLDSLKLEESLVNLYENTAVVTFIVHTYKKDKGKPTEKRTRFYDVWVNRNGEWKVVAGQGTVVEPSKKE